MITIVIRVRVIVVIIVGVLVGSIIIGVVRDAIRVVDVSGTCLVVLLVGIVVFNFLIVVVSFVVLVNKGSKRVVLKGLIFLVFGLIFLVFVVVTSAIFVVISILARIRGTLIIVVVEATRHSCVDTRETALAVNANPVAFSGGDGKEVRVKGLVRGIRGDII